MSVDAAGSEVAAALGGVLADLLRASHLADPSEVARIVSDIAQGLGAREVVLYRLDYDQTQLVPVPSPAASDRTVQPVDGSLAGRAFITSGLVEGEPHGDPADHSTPSRRLWVPLVDGTERVGVMELTFDAGADGHVPEDLRDAAARYAALVCELVVSKTMYGDVFEFVRRRQRPSVAAEVQWNLLPPLTVATDALVVSAVLEPAYDVGGDSFDYAVNGGTAHVALFDAMGHGLSASLLATVAVGAYRNSRRSLDGLVETYRFVDEMLLAHGRGEQFATGVLVELDVPTGSLRWINAGHPTPLLVRGGRLVRPLELEPATPFGLGLDGSPPPVGEVDLQPGDRVLLYTDGVTEARTADGDFFGVERLVDFVGREGSSGRVAPEALRRLGKAVLEHQQGRLDDDATTVLIEWRGDSGSLVPQ